MSSDSHNTQEIQDSDLLYRRLAIIGHFTPDGKVSSNAFKLNGKPDPAISVDLGRLTTQEKSLNQAKNPSAIKIGAVKAGFPRSLHLEVAHDPQPENPSHSLIKGNKTRENCRLLAEQTEVLATPTQPFPPILKKESHSGS